ncbi:3'-phosphatase [Vibrio phage K122]
MGLDNTKLREQDPNGIDQHDSGGGSCSYYIVGVDKPTTLNGQYTVECNDLIEALELSYAEANIYKEIFRTANERTHNNGKQGNNPKRAAEKVLFFALRNAIHHDVDIEKFLSELNLK